VPQGVEAFRKRPSRRRTPTGVGGRGGRARRAQRPLAEVPRYLLTRAEAAACLGMSVPTFERRVQPLIKVVRTGQLVLVPPRELERWIRENERYTMSP
jgi:hypothetical protein